MSQHSLGALSYYSSKIVNSTTKTFKDKNSKFHAILSHSAEALHSLVLLVENLFGFLKEQLTAAVNSKAADKFSTKVLVPILTTVYFLKDQVVEQSIVLYHKLFK